GRMSGRQKKDRAVPDLEITAQPTGLPEELTGRSAHEHEAGLSVDADELGRTFLRDATEQGNFESEYDDSTELSEGPQSDDALSGPNFDPNNDVWENTVNLTLQGSDDGEPLIDDHVDGLRFMEDDDETTSSDDLDLTDNAVHDASLLDGESDEYGETKSPSLRTDDAHSHNRPRGGHKPKTKPVNNQR
ncbi:MAG TPA: hypothetical protein VI299_24110, partial [Polyangiales bacterium]